MMNRNEVVNIDKVKTDLTDAIGEFQRRLIGVFGEFVFGIDTMVARYNLLEQRHDALQQRFDAVEARLTNLEKRGNGH